MKSKLQALLAGHVACRENKRVVRFQQIGSSLYHPDPKDVDLLVLLNSEVDNTGPFNGRWSFGTGWDLPAGEYDEMDGTWYTLRNGDVNLIVTTDPGWYARALLANEVCCALRLMDKLDRVKVYRVIRDGKDAADCDGYTLNNN